jgi:CheY-like chemotaxis protein
MISSTIISNEPSSRAALNAPGDVDVQRKPVQILIVDDNQDSAEAMALMLECFGHEVSMAFSGEASLIELERRDVDVVLLDLSLPDMHGTAVAQRMRASGFEGKVIAVSGYSDASTKERCSRAGMDHFLVKPCSIQALRALF